MVLSKGTEEMNQLLGEVRLIAYDDVPAGWMKCEGQALDINVYPRLYMMLGTKFGRAREYQFMLPDLREKAPSGMVYCIAAEGELPTLEKE
jgi:microcystin-dependent protein